MATPCPWISLRLKVALLIQEKPTPFTDGIPGSGWFWWFKKRHPNLAMTQAQVLELSRAKDLCPEKVVTFYSNLSELYSKYNYPATHVWNCDETGAHARQNGGGRVWARRGSRSVHSLLPVKNVVI